MKRKIQQTFHRGQLDITSLHALHNLEQQIAKKCGHERYIFTITFESRTNTYFLNMFIDNVKVSHIEWNFLKYANRVSLEIESFTEDRYRRNQFNTILRILTLQLVPNMTYDDRPIEKVVSSAYNWISIYTLHKLGFIIDVVWNCSGSKRIPIPEIPTIYTSQFIRDYFGSFGRYTAELIMRDINTHNFSDNLKTAITNMKCTLQQSGS